METDPNPPTHLLKPLVRDEYAALRAEIVKRIELRQQLISILLTLAGVLLAFGLTRPAVALLYPPIAASLAFGWYHNDYRIGEIARYIRRRLENETTGLGYETYVQETRGKTKPSASVSWMFLSHGGTILVTQILALGIAVVQYPFPFVGMTPGEFVLLILDVLCVIVVWTLITRSRR